jgi:hydroxypyruvate isomerase
MRLSAHIGYLYAELPMAARPAAAAADGFTAVEHPTPFEVPAPQMRAMLDGMGLRFAQVSSGMGDVARGEKGLAALPGRQDAFREGFDRALDYALTVGCRLVHPMAGVPLPGTDPAAVRDVYAENLDWAAGRATAAGVQLLVEPISAAAVPGYALSHPADAIRLQDAVGPGRLRLLFDTFHACAQGIVPQDWIAEHGWRIGHLHVADHPGRHEPGTGRIHFGAVLDALTAIGFGGAIGFEYVPARDTRSSVGFLAGWNARLNPAAPADDVVVDPGGATRRALTAERRRPDDQARHPATRGPARP